MVNCVGQSVTPFHQRPQHGTVSPNMPHILTRSQENLAYAATVHSVSCFLTGNARKKKSRTAIDKAPTHWNSRTAPIQRRVLPWHFPWPQDHLPSIRLSSRRVLRSRKVAECWLALRFLTRRMRTPMCKWNSVAMSSELFAQHH